MQRDAYEYNRRKAIDAWWIRREGKSSGKEIPFSVKHNRPACPGCGHFAVIIISGSDVSIESTPDGQGSRHPYAMVRRSRYRCENCSTRFTYYWPERRLKSREVA